MCFFLQDSLYGWLPSRVRVCFCSLTYHLGDVPEIAFIIYVVLIKEIVILNLFSGYSRQTQNEPTFFVHKILSHIYCLLGVPHSGGGGHHYAIL